MPILTHKSKKPLEIIAESVENNQTGRKKQGESVSSEFSDREEILSN
jgi:hypothetical protein